MYIYTYLSYPKLVRTSSGGPPAEKVSPISPTFPQILKCSPARVRENNNNNNSTSRGLAGWLELGLRHRRGMYRITVFLPRIRTRDGIVSRSSSRTGFADTVGCETYSTVVTLTLGAIPLMDIPRIYSPELVSSSRRLESFWG